MQKGFRDTLSCDDSDIVNKVVEKYNAPETCIIKENNSCFGGNICEEVNKVRCDDSKKINDVACNKQKDVGVYAGWGGPQACNTC